MTFVRRTPPNRKAPVPLFPYTLQLVVLGTIWVTFHCVGMCGPIVAGLNTSRGPDPEETGWLRRGASNILAYQFGRAVTYATFGAAAGLVGRSVDAVISGTGNVMALAVGGALVLFGAARLLGLELPYSTSQMDGDSVGGRLGRVARRLVRLVGGSGRGTFVVFGAVMGFLPCMLMFWVLGLAASTGSAAAGAAVMVGLVVLTTPVLVAAGTAPLAAGSSLQRHGAAIAGGALVVSGAWLLLIGTASMGWIPHAGFSFETGLGSLKMMFW